MHLLRHVHLSPQWIHTNFIIFKEKKYADDQHLIVDLIPSVDLLSSKLNSASIPREHGTNDIKGRKTHMQLLLDLLWKPTNNT